MLKLDVFGAILCLMLPITVADGLPAATTDLKSMVGEEGNYFEGDIILTKSQAESVEKNGLTDLTKRWQGGVVFYKINDIFSTDELSAIRSGMVEIQALTCVRFAERQDEIDYVFITKGAGCSSQRARVGGRQSLSLAEDRCFVHGTVMHELMHALGFHHEQNRPDRDDYVDIVWENIIRGRERNFDKMTEDEGTAFGQDYDYLSVMHYTRTHFAIDPTKPTIITKNGSYIGQRAYLTDIDIAKIRTMYHCDE